MKVHCICPLCGSEAEKESTFKCTIFYCSKCHEFEINTFENEPTLSYEDKQILSNYFVNSAKYLIVLTMLEVYEFSLSYQATV